MFNLFKWSNRNLTFKYGLVFAFTVSLFVISAILINLLLFNTRDEVSKMNQSTENAVKLYEMELLIQGRYSILGQHIVSPTNYTVSEFEDSIEKFNTYLGEIQPFIDSEQKEYLIDTVLENDQEIIESFYEYSELRSDETTANINRRIYENARRNYQQSAFSLNQLREIFEQERLNSIERTTNSFMRTNQILIYSIVISIIFGVITLILVSKNIKKRLSNIIDFSERIKRGDLSSNNLDTKGNDEFSKISTALNTMKIGIEKILADIYSVSNNISINSLDIENSTTFLKGVSEDVSDTLSELITIVEQQSASIVEISDTNTNFNEKVNTIGQLSVVMKEASHDVAVEAREGISLMNMTVNNISSVNQTVGNTVNKVNDLVDRAKDISQITALVNKVADKTNLLALNASIEAARAGEYGRGFAVVAEEIRNLSNEVNQSINNINIITEGIQKEANAVKTVLISSNETTRQEQKKLEDNIASLLKIDHSITDLVTSIDNISESIKTMTKESDIINTSLDDLTALSDKTTKHINETSKAIFDQHKVIDQIDNHSNDLFLAANKLDDTMNHFTVETKVASDQIEDEIIIEPEQPEESAVAS